MFVPTAIFLLLLDFVGLFFFPSPFVLQSYDLMSIFRVVFVLLFHFFVSVYCSFLVCNSHQVLIQLSIYLSIYISTYLSISLSFPYVKGEKDDDPREHLLSRVFREHEEKAIAFLQQGNVFTPYFQRLSQIFIHLLFLPVIPSSNLKSSPHRRVP